MNHTESSVHTTRDAPGKGGSAGLSTPIQRYLAGYLLLLLLVCAACHVRFILHNPIWSQYDEIANYDYIERLGQGQLPHAEDDIADYSAEITFRYFTWLETLHFNGSVESMGAAGRSYQAHQPPLYFLLLTPVNLALKAAGVSPPFEIKFLRMLNVPLWLAACAVTILVFRELSTLVGWSPVYGYYAAVLTYVFGFDLRSHIGADALSPLVGAIFFYLLLRKWRTGRQAYATWSALAAALCFLTKYTHAFFPIIWAVSMVFFYRKHPGQPLRNKVLHVAPYLLVPLYFLINVLQYGAGDPLRTGATRDLFGFVQPVLNVWHVLYNFVDTAFSMKPVFEYGNLIPALVFLLLAFNYSVSFYRLFVSRENSVVPIFVACQISVALVVAALVLNAYREGVYWWTFRIYYGYTIPWLVSVTATPYLVIRRWFREAWAVAGLVLVTCLVGLRVLNATGGL